MRRTAAGVLSVVVGVVFGLVGCKNSPTTFDEFKKDPQLARIVAMPDDTTKERLLGDFIESYIADRTCTGPGQCRTMGIGHNPCGGPWGYIIFSVGVVNPDTLAAIVAVYDDLNDAMNRKYGRVGPCVVLPPPQVGCVDGRCEKIGR